MPSVYEPLVAELRRRRHVFWHAPASVRTPEFSKELIELLGGVYPGVNLIDCTNLPRDPARGIVDVDRLNNSADVNVLVDFDHLIDHVYGRTWMRQLRPPLMSALENDKCLLVLSRRPQSAFPQVEGSNLATDAPGFYLARINDPDDLSAISTPADDLSKEYADWLLSVSGGIVGLLARLLPACHRLGKTARKKVAKGIVQEIVGETVRDCGPLLWLGSSITTSMDRVISSRVTRYPGRFLTHYELRPSCKLTRSKIDVHCFPTCRTPGSKML